jgi:uncharacterized protein DUF3306
MSDFEEQEREDFLRRWSRLKAQQRSESAETLPARADADGDAAPPVLPPMGELTLESDYRGFFHPKVEETLRRTALKKLFSDPHFNIMDGLDVYIDDYSKSDPLPAAMLDQLEHAQKILRWARESRESPPGAQAAGPAVLADAGTTLPSAVEAPASAPDSAGTGTESHDETPPEAPLEDSRA